MDSPLVTIVKMWPIFLGFITLVIVLAKMHSSIEVLQEKVKVLYELYNNWNKRKRESDE
jgi:hypothetical protein